jgi:hypothetical protein
MGVVRGLAAVFLGTRVRLRVAVALPVGVVLLVACIAWVSGLAVSWADRRALEGGSRLGTPGLPRLAQRAWLPQRGRQGYQGTGVRLGGRADRESLTRALDHLAWSLQVILPAGHAPAKRVHETGEVIHRKPEGAGASSALPDAKHCDPGIGIPTQTHAARTAAHVKEDFSEPGQWCCVRR